MSQFRDALRQHFEDNEINIVHLSRQCGVDRTTIQHMVGNRKEYRLPSFDAFRDVLSHMQITPGERKHLEELFTIEKIGVHNYSGRKYVKSIIEQIASLHNYSGHSYITTPNIQINFNTFDCVFKGANATNSVLYFVCTEETESAASPRICLNVPFTYNYLQQTLLQKHLALYKKLKIEHLVTLSKSPKTNANPNINLEIISSILPLAFCAGGGYHVNYYYTGLDPENELFLAMPYYLITGKRLLLLSDDFASAILISDMRIIEEYRSIFTARYSQCHSLIQHLVNPLEIFDAYTDCMDDGCPAFSVEATPCMFQHLTEDIISRAVLWGLPNMDIAVAGFVKYINSFSKMSVSEYFPIEGVDNFAKTGRLSALSETQVNAFTIHDRITMLESLYKEIKNGSKTRLIDSSKIFLSQKAIISTINNNSLQFYYCDASEYHYCVIWEPSIVGSFVDFFESLPQSDMLFSGEETLAIIQSYIDKLKNQNCGMMYVQQIF